MRLIGFDPGLRHTGWGVIEAHGNRLTHVADGVVHAPHRQALAERLVELFRQLNAVLEEHDVLLTPVTAAQPEPVGKWQGKGPVRTFYGTGPYVTYTAVWN